MFYTGSYYNKVKDDDCVFLALAVIADHPLPRLAYPMGNKPPKER